MKVRLLVSRAGVGQDGRGFAQSVGDEIDVEDAEGKRLVAAGHAVADASEPVQSKKRKRTATQNQANTEKR